MMEVNSSAISSPGKVLFAGGYLVLDRSYSGLVFALSSRIHVTSAPLSGHPEGTLLVESPQFKNAHWAYQISRNIDGAGVLVAQIEQEGSSENIFVEAVLRYTLSYLSVVQPDVPFFFPSIKLTILADNDFYSQPNSDRPLPKFNNLDIPIFEAHKTGLGSSAALVTSLTACLLSTYSKEIIPLDLTSEETLNKVHNLAQAAHCAAQGKIGSGFDVAAAVYGSCVYRRFSPGVLETLQYIEEAVYHDPNHYSEEVLYNPNHFALKVAEVVDSKWDHLIQTTRLPPGLRVLMGDVDCGSSTPGMVRHVLEWREANKAVANEMWDSIEEMNLSIINKIADFRLAEAELLEDYYTALHTLAATKGMFTAAQGSRNVVIQVMRQFENKILSIRSKIREMGNAANVPIEPESQTKLLDFITEQCPGVLGGVVPGAGGYDAFALLIADYKDVVDVLKENLADYKVEGEREVRVEILQARQDYEGLRIENRGVYLVM